MASVRSGNQWVLWLSWTEPVCHKHGILFADTKSFYLWQKMSLFVEDQYWVRSSYDLSQKKSSHLPLCWIWPTNIYLARWKGELCQCWEEAAASHSCFIMSQTWGGLRGIRFYPLFYLSAAISYSVEPPLKPILELYIEDTLEGYIT